MAARNSRRHGALLPICSMLLYLACAAILAFSIATGFQTELLPAIIIYPLVDFGFALFAMAVTFPILFMGGSENLPLEYKSSVSWADVAILTFPISVFMVGIVAYLGPPIGLTGLSLLPLFLLGADTLAKTKYCLESGSGAQALRRLLEKFGINVPFALWVMSVMWNHTGPLSTIPLSTWLGMLVLWYVLSAGAELIFILRRGKQFWEPVENRGKGGG